MSAGFCHPAVMSPVATAAPEAATVPARPRRSLADLAAGPRRDTALAARVLAEDDKRLVVSGFNSSV